MFDPNPIHVPGNQPDPRQVENGHLRLANGIVADLRKLPIPLRHKEVIRAVQEKTYGWQKTADRISLSQLDDMLGFGKPNLSRIVNDLLQWNLLFRTESGQIGYQKHPEHWQLEDRYNIREAKRTRMLAAREKSPTTVKHQEAESPASRGLSKSDGLSENDNENVSENDNHKRQERQKDIADPNGSSMASDKVAAPKKSRSRKKPDPSKAPICPHQQIVELWEKHFPDKPVMIELDDSFKDRIRKGWQFTWRANHPKSGQPLFIHHHTDNINPDWPRGDQAQGLDWWNRFFRYLAEYCSEMAKEGWFTFGMFIRPEKIRKAMLKTYTNRSTQ